jgi:hypothetical protein
MLFYGFCTVLRKAWEGQGGGTESKLEPVLGTLPTVRMSSVPVDTALHLLSLTRCLETDKVMRWP